MGRHREQRHAAGPRAGHAPTSRSGSPGIPEATAEDIGWSKFHLLCPYLTEDNWQELTRFAQRSTQPVIEARLRGNDDGTMKKFRLDQDGLATLDRALGTAKALTGAGTEAEALVAIAEAFLNVGTSGCAAAYSQR